jgi:hypothetical protein
MVAMVRVVALLIAVAFGIGLLIYGDVGKSVWGPSTRSANFDRQQR